MSADRHETPELATDQQPGVTPDPGPASPASTQPASEQPASGQPTFGPAASPVGTSSGKAAVPSHAKQPGPAAGSDRLAREAAALRANLQRRKQQARQRRQADPKDRSEP